MLWQWIKSYKIFSLFQNFRGGFLTRRGTLAGIVSKIIPSINNQRLLEIRIRPINGNNNLFKNLDDDEIQIKNIDPTEGSSRIADDTKTKKKRWFF